MNTQIHSQTELRALISLLDEPQEENFVSIREKVNAYGLEAIPFLERACVDSSGSEHKDRVRSLISEIFFNDTYKSLINWSEGEGLNLIDAYLSISRMLNPGTDTQKYFDDYEGIRKDVWLEINDNLTALEKVRVLNHIIYDFHSFAGQRSPNGNKLRLYYPDYLFENRKGNSLTLGILYLAIAQNLEVPIYGVDLPGHFVLCYLDEKPELKPASEYKQQEVMFYLNAMNKGAVFTHNEIKSFVAQMNLKPQESFFTPCSNKEIIKRLLKEVSQEEKLNGDKEKSAMLLKLTEAVC
jgi:regulator of sirC expression with transglutaminase-like and TPR domain